MNEGQQRIGRTAANGAATIDPNKLPQHVAIIMDGNGRWAQNRGSARTVGHRAGVQNLRTIVRASVSIGIPMLTVFAFSTENWERPPEEVAYLMKLLDEVLEREADELHRNGVRIRVIGARTGLPESTLRAIEAVERRTAGNTRLWLNVAWNYGGRADILQAVRRIAERVAAGDLAPEAIDEQLFTSFLYTAGMPDPDLVIRTGGELRISNFLLWQSAYAELYVSDVYWPDFDEEHYRKAIIAYQGRQRRFGGL
ncbi:MAG: isoprenyl transferase [Firmicutes bacterium]|jgi:undecaprenyl diphosphate synthase|nr:isoprenyl transferase [Bacillota bacterium]